MIQFQDKTILVAPLPWGLGHVSRLVPLLNQFVRNSNKVYVYAPPHLLEWLSTQVKGFIPIEENSYEFTYGISFNLWKAFILPYWVILHYFQDKKKVNKLVNSLHPDLIISDHRYGFYHANLPSYFLTHQVMPALPSWAKLFKPLIQNILKKIYKKYTALWILDYETMPGLAGELSHPHFLNDFPHIFLGPQSRFTTSSSPCKKENQLTWILSGPTRHRKKMLQKIIKTFSSIQLSVHVFGFISPKIKHIPPHIHLHDANSQELEKLIKKSKWIISHCGYSTLMDLHILREKAWLFPTPGQPEQSLLLHLHRNNHYCFKNFKELMRALQDDIKKTLHFRH